MGIEGEQIQTTGWRRALIFAACGVGILSGAYFGLELLRQSWLEEFLASPQCCAPGSAPTPFCQERGSHLRWASWGLGETASAARREQAACEARRTAPPAPPPAVVPPVAAAALPAVAAGGPPAPAPNDEDDEASADGEGDDDAPVAPLCSDAPQVRASLAALREALAMPLAQRVEQVRGWACEDAPSAVALLTQAGAALRADGKQPPQPAGVPPLTLAEARRTLCELPWGMALTAAGQPPVTNLFSCPACPNEDCAEDPSCSCGVPTDRPGRQNDADCLLSYAQISYRTLEREDLHRCEVQAREANGAFIRLARQRDLALKEPLFDKCVELTQDGSDVRVHLDDGSWKTFKWNEQENESPSFSVKSVDCLARRVLIAGTNGYSLLDVRTGAVIDGLGHPPLWSPDGRYFAGGWPDPEISSAREGAAIVWYCPTEQPCKRIWSDAELIEASLRGGLNDASDATWTGAHTVRLELGSDKAPILCDCSPGGCSCAKAPRSPAQ